MGATAAPWDATAAKFTAEPSSGVDRRDRGRLSATAQSIGYLIAATGPLAVGLLHQATGDWTASLVLLLVAVTGQVAIGIAAGRARLVGADA